MARPSVGARMSAAWRAIRGLPAAPARRPRRSVRNAFQGASTDRLFADWVAQALHPDDETRLALPRLRARARDLDRNNGLAHHFFDLLEIHVVGPTGMTLSAQVRDRKGELARKTNLKIEEAWYRWAAGPVSYDQTLDFVSLQKLLVRTAAMDGEAFVRIHREKDPRGGLGLYFEPIDADLVDETLTRARRGAENEIRQGIEVDARGRRVAYWLRDPGGYHATIDSMTRVSADDMIPIMNPRRVNQTRGITWLAPSMFALRQEGAYTDAELVSARIGSSKMGFYTRKQDDLGGVDPEPAGAAEESDDGVPEGSFNEDIEPGVFRKLPDGWEFQSFDPQHPTTAYGDFTKNIVRRIASGLTAVSYESLSNDRESTTYSSSRTGLLLERDAMKCLHSWWTFQFLSRVYSEFMTWALLTGYLELESRDPAAYLAAKWQPRGWDWVDPLNDVQAAKIQIDNGLTSRQRLLNERGMDIYEVFEELALEKELAAKYGLELARPPAGQAPAADSAAAPASDAKPRAALSGALAAETNGHGSALNGAGR